MVGDLLLRIFLWRTTYNIMVTEGIRRKFTKVTFEIVVFILEMSHLQHKIFRFLVDYYLNF